MKKIVTGILSIIFVLGALSEILSWLNITPKQLTSNNLIIVLLNFLNFKIPLYIVSFIVLVVTITLFRIFKVDKRKVNTQIAGEQKINHETKNKYSKESSMSNEEKYILTILTKVDGRALTFSEIQGGINCSNVRTRNAIDKLKRRYLIKRYGGPYHPEAYVLTEEGREFVIGFNLDEKLKNP